MRIGATATIAILNAVNEGGIGNEPTAATLKHAGGNFDVEGHSARKEFTFCIHVDCYRV